MPPLHKARAKWGEERRIVIGHHAECNRGLVRSMEVAPRRHGKPQRAGHAQMFHVFLRQVRTVHRLHGIEPKIL